MADIDFKAPITGLDGQPRQDKDGNDVTLGNVAITALVGDLATVHGEPERLRPEQKVANAKLATDIYAATKPLKLKSEDVALLKDRIGRAWDAVTVMRAWALLEGEDR